MTRENSIKLYFYIARFPDTDYLGVRKTWAIYDSTGHKVMEAERYDNDVKKLKEEAEAIADCLNDTGKEPKKCLTTE